MKGYPGAEGTYDFDQNGDGLHGYNNSIVKNVNRRIVFSTDTSTSTTREYGTGGQDSNGQRLPLVVSRDVGSFGFEGIPTKRWVPALDFKSTAKEQLGYIRGNFF